jgi:hypothetical protein
MIKIQYIYIYIYIKKEIYKSAAAIGTVTLTNLKKISIVLFIPWNEFLVVYA